VGAPTRTRRLAPRPEPDRKKGAAVARREAVAAMRLIARALVLRRAPAPEWSPDDRITLDAFLRTPTGGRFYDALALLAVTAALRGVEERPFEAGVTAGMGRVVREIDGMRGGKRGDGSLWDVWKGRLICYFQG
jgi:hypothetical protein